MNTNIEKALKSAILALAVIGVAAPLVLTNLLYFSFTFPKMTLFQLAVEAMFFLWIPLAVYTPKYRPNLKNPILISLFLLVTTLAITALLGLDPSMSFWGYGHRMTGVNAYIHLFAWVLVLTSTLRGWDQWKVVLFSSNAVCLIADAVGFFHEIPSSTHSRLSSVIGNSLYFGTYALIHVFVAVFLFSKAGHKREKAFFAFSALAHTVTVFYTGSRGPILAFFACGTIALCAYLFKRFTSKKARALGVSVIALAILLFAGTLLFLRLSFEEEWIRQHVPGPAQRLVLTDLGENRTQLWDLTFDMIAMSPWIGHGIESYGILFNTVYNPTEAPEVIKDVAWVDRAHNQYLDLLVSAGALGLAAYLALFIVTFFVIRKSSLSPLQKTLLALPFLALLMENLFFFDEVNTNIILFSLFAFVGGLVPVKESPHKESSPLFFVTAFGCFVLFFLTAFPLTLQPLSRAYIHAIAVGRLRHGYEVLAMEPMYQTYEGSVPFTDSFLFWDNDAWIPGMEHALEHTNVTEEMLRFQIILTERFTFSRPTDFKAHMTTARMYRLLSRYDSDALETARIYAEAAIPLAEGRPEGYEQLMEVALAEENIEEAREHLEDAKKRLGELGYTWQRLSAREAAVLAMEDDLISSLEVLRSLEGANSLTEDVRAAIELSRALERSETIDDKIAIDILRYVDFVWAQRPTNEPLLRARRDAYASVSEAILVAAIALPFDQVTYLSLEADPDPEVE